MTAQRLLYRVDRWDHDTYQWKKVKTVLAVGSDQAIGRVSLQTQTPVGTVLRACLVRA